MGMFSGESPKVFLNGIEPEIVTDLRMYLEYEDMVILIDIDGANPLTEMLCRSEALLNTDKQVVVIGTVNYPSKPGKHIYRTISEREMRVLLHIYRSYESSDKLFLLSDSRNYGSAWNYVSNGMITEQEMFEAMFA